MDEKKRKSSRSFELEKGEKRTFDLNKTSARKFDLAKESGEVSLEELKKVLLADGRIDAEEVNKLRDVLYADGKIDQEEADFLFEINDAVSGKDNDSSWNQFFVETISDYLLNDEKSPGVIDEEEGKWLVEKIGADGQVDGAEKQLLSHLVKNAKKMPVTVTALMTGASTANAISSDLPNLQQMKKEILADGKIDKDEVKQLRKTLYADGKIDQEEADFLFEINDAVSGKKNDPAWNQFFVEAISDYLLNDEKSHSVIDEEEGKWLVEKIGADGQVDGVEKQLLNHLNKKAKKMPAAVTALMTSVSTANAIPSNQKNLQQLKNELLADGKVDKDEVNRLRHAFYADGKIDKEEADFLFELNDAVSGNDNDPSWNQFFVEAISDYLLNDEKSPGVIDDEEGKWLVEKIGADGQLDSVEKQLLNHLNKKAKKIPASVTALLTGISTHGCNVEHKGKWKQYVAIFLGLLLLGGVCYYLSQQGGDTPQVLTEVIDEQDSDATVTNGTTAIQNERGQEDNVSPANVEAESPADDIPAVGGACPIDDAPSTAASSTPEQKEGNAASPPTVTKGSTLKADAPKKETSTQSEERPQANISSISASSSVSGTVEEEAWEVIRGKYGNGEDRKRNLGARYAEIQSRVNEIYRDKGWIY